MLARPVCFSILLVLLAACYYTPSPSASTAKIHGLTVVAPPAPFAADPMPAVRALGAGWVAVVPYAFTPPGQATVRYHAHGKQWWGERPEGVAETVRLAHGAGLKCMLKPQVWIPRGWTGTLDFATAAEWERWEAAYRAYVLLQADLADSLGVELFCIGTEFGRALTQRPAFWHGLIDSVRAHYGGKLVYSANWDDWEAVPFWSKLDYIGLGAYFPLVAAATPDEGALRAAWQPVKARLADVSRRTGKPVLFTEYGYLSVDSAGWRNWELERNIERRNVNQTAQARAYEALFASFAHESWWAGGFLWKWFPNGEGHEGYPERDYTPQGKEGEAVLRRWYRR
jgi:hypothetical protein